MVTTINKQVLDELNLCRADPKKYSLKLANTLKYYKGKIYEKPGRIPIETREGTVNVDACISFLQGTRPFPPLKWSNSLYLAAQAHADDIGKLGLMGHNSSDGIEPSERIGKYCKWSGSLGENIDYGNNIPEDIIISLLVDDGVLARGQRLNIMNRDHNYVGIAVGFHAEFDHICVIVFAEEIVNDTEEIHEEKNENKSLSDGKIKKKPSQQGFTKTKLRKMRTKEAFETFIERPHENAGLSAKEIAEIKAVFDMFDSDSAGTIESIDLKSIMDNQEISELSAFMKYTENDLENKEKITFDEFLEIMTEKSSVPMSVSQSEISRYSQFSDFSSIKSVSVASYQKKSNQQEKINMQKYLKFGLPEEQVLQIKKIFDIVQGYFLESSNASTLKTLINNHDWDEISQDIILAVKSLTKDEVEESDFDNFITLIVEKIKQSKASKRTPQVKCNSVNNSIRKFPQKPLQRSRIKNFDPSLYERDNLTRDDIIEIKNAFDMFDIDNNGTINPNELKNAMENQGYKNMNSTVFNLVSNMPVDGIEKVNFEQYIELMSKEAVDDTSVEEIRRLFRMFDVEGTGFIELSNLKRIARELGESLDERDMRELLKQSDLDGDGRVSFQDFYSIMNK